MGKDSDCGCKGKVARIQGPALAPGGAGRQSSLINSLVAAAELLGGDTSQMANSELIDALCAALVEARQEKQALAAALDQVHQELEAAEEALDDCQAGDVGDEE